MKYKVGDKVRVKSFEWYNENKDEFGDVRTPNNVFVPGMSRFCGQEVTISNVEIGASDNVSYYSLTEDTSDYSWTDDMFEENAEETSLQGEFGLLENKINGIFFCNENYADKVELCLGNDYEIVVEDGRTFIQKKKLKYPKTFIEVLNFWHPDRQIEDDYQRYYKKDLIEKFQNLLYARDAYWKIAGEEMGLGKSWEPDWADNYQKKWLITFYQDEINFTSGTNVQFILAFPTEEMRDVFYENFKNLIEKCEKLL